MKQYLTGLALSLISICSFAGNPVSVMNMPTDGWEFHTACNGEIIAVDAGQSLRARIRVLGTPEDNLHVINRVTGHLVGTGQITGQSYFINQVFSPIVLGDAPGGMADQIILNNGHGSATFMTRYEVSSPGAPELGILIVHGLVHIVFRGDIDTFEVTKDDNYFECRGPNNS